jgi:hypothetical protein
MNGENVLFHLYPFFTFMISPPDINRESLRSMIVFVLYRFQISFFVVPFPLHDAISVKMRMVIEASVKLKTLMI